MPGPSLETVRKGDKERESLLWRRLPQRHTLCTLCIPSIRGSYVM